MDYGTGLAILGTTLGSAKVAEKILGPTAEYIGTGLKQFTEKSINNVKDIFLHAERKLGDRIDEPGAVPPKVLKGILQEGAFCDDKLSGEYFGGVLASSRSEVARDDRGASFIALVSRLTTYQIRSHYIFYRLFQNLFSGQEFSVNSDSDRKKMQMFLPFDVYTEAMAFGDNEDVNSLVSHVMFGLDNENLILQSFQFGHVEHIRQHFSKADKPGLLIQPSALGVELCLWAHGRGDIGVFEFLNLEVAFPVETEISIPPGAVATRSDDA